MKVAVFHWQQHAIPHLNAFVAGLRRHGIEPECRNLSLLRGAADVDADLAVCWGYRADGLIRRQKETGRHLLVLERGYVGDRMQWTSTRFDGLNGRGWCPPAPDSGERFERYFSMKPWDTTTGDLVLLVGQVRWDTATANVDLPAWYTDMVAQARHFWGYLPLVFRPHPNINGRHDRVSGVPVLRGELDDALERAALVITWNSNVGVLAALAGCPVIAMDEGSMAWPVASQQMAIVRTPDRSRWAADLAWSQWRLDELADGLAWEHLASGLESV